MPAILTHDFFGRDTLEAFGQHVEDSTIDERDAFLLGNQGPDPLFFLAIHPSLRSFTKLGQRMHRERTAELIHALYHCLELLDGRELDVGRAYAQGFLGHFALDSHVHPLVYYTQRAICDAGIEGLSREDSREVHAEIERELDEMVLTAKRGQTVRDYPAIDNTLEASPEMLAVVQKMYAYLALTVYGLPIHTDLWATAVECYRIALAAMHSPYGIKRAIVMRAERQFRNHSYFGALAHRAHLVEDSWFANSDHNSWENPFTGECRTVSFWDLYEEALDAVADAIERFESSRFDLDDARELTSNLNFAGDSTVPILMIEE